ncbi:MAG: dioxygenase [Gammaproteobacteria bacterium]|nr:dioxygenase [Gammaproteobacteria bacterium]
MHQSALYIPHGAGPCFFMDWTPKGQWDPLANYLSGLITRLPEPPRCLVVFSAHWESDPILISADQTHSLFYDYWGFPEHTYQFQWAPTGAPAVAHKIEGLLNAQGIASSCVTGRGLDHGVFVPLMLADPNATIPVVQVSLHPSLDPTRHLEIGRALQPLLDDQVLCIGSGLSFHNVDALRGRAPGGRAERFAEALQHAVQVPDARRDRALSDLMTHPERTAAHPTTEHLIPLHVMAGLSNGPGYIPFVDTIYGSTIVAVEFTQPR